MDQSLDDIIKSNKPERRSSAGRGGSSGRGRGGSTSSKGAARFTPYQKPAPQQQQQRAAPAVLPPALPISSPTIHISNLDQRVSDEDIKELFGLVGRLKSSSLHYNKHGQSAGTAEVTFVRPQDATAAIQKYHGVELDGRPMRIVLVGGAPSVLARVTPSKPQQNNNTSRSDNSRSDNNRGSNRNNADGARSSQSRGSQQPRGASRGAGRGAGRGRGGNRGERRNRNVTAEELDKEMDDFRASATAEETHQETEAAN